MPREIDEIKDTAGAYRKWALEARKKYIELRLRQDPEIRGLYIRAADRVSKELRKLVLKTPSSYLRKRQLEELEAALRTEADRLTGNLTKAFEQYIEQAVEAGGGYGQAIELDLFKKAGMDITRLRTMFATVNRQAVEACWARTKKGLFLSDRIWQQGENFRNTMRDIIQEAVATGQDAVKTARMLQQYVRQGKSTLAANYPNMMERMKGRIPGDISYEALRLARTEMTAAFGEGTIAAAQVSPSYQGMKWVLSHSHPVVDICDTLAEHDEGLGRGVYSPGNEPPFPAHPNCLCALVPVHEDPEKFVQRLKKWRDDPTSEPELEKWYQSHYLGKVVPKPKASVPVTKPEAKPEKKPVAATPGAVDTVSPVEMTEELKGIIKRYTTGAYKNFNAQADAYLKGTPKEKAFSKAGEMLFNAVNASTQRFTELFRIVNLEGFEIDSDNLVVKSPLELGQELVWGLRSTSKSGKFIAKAAQGKDKNLPFVGGKDITQRTVYRLKNETGLDVTSISPYKQQEEVIVSGKFKVMSIGVEEIGKQPMIVIDLQRSN